MRKDDLIFVGHMYDRVGQVVAKLQGLSQADFDADENLRLAVLHLIQEVGEAANRVSPAFRTAHAQIPWPAIIGMRHRIVHNYFDIDFDIVWKVATGDFPQLLIALEGAAPPMSDDAGGPA